MSTIRKLLVNATLQRSTYLLDTSIYDNIHKHHEFRKRTVLADEVLTKEEKDDAIRILNRAYDREKLFYNEGTKRICENCNQECIATTYCEFCVRNHLRTSFSNWTSGNKNIDDLIQKTQMEALGPNRIVEWIPYSNLQNIEYLTKGGYSKIYTADWIDGRYYEWDTKEQQLTRKHKFGTQCVILKRLENVENANQNWLEEAKLHLTMSNKWENIVQCFGLTQDPSNGNYMLVMKAMKIDLRNYLKQNHDQLTWKERIQITYDIIDALDSVHRENVVHRDLHPGNILKRIMHWRISDLGLCGPADKPTKSIYGCLPYIAPEVIAGKQYTFKSDIYSIGMIMWEISSGQPPFDIYEHNSDLAINIINGIRPKIVLGTPSEYKDLIEKCWDANPAKRPHAHVLLRKFDKINLHYQNISDEPIQSVVINDDLKTNYTSSGLFTSKVHKLADMPEPRNATKEEQDAFYTKSYDFDNIEYLDEDFDKSNNNQYEDDKNLTKAFDKLQLNL